MQLLYQKLLLKHIFIKVTAKWTWFCKKHLLHMISCLNRIHCIYIQQSKVNSGCVPRQGNSLVVQPQRDNGGIQIFLSVTHNIPIGLKWWGETSKLVLYRLKKFPNNCLWGEVRNSGARVGQEGVSDCWFQNLKKNNNKRKENAYASPEGHPNTGTLPENLKQL